MNSPVYLKIQDFLTLRQGWCYGDGLSFSRAIADIATQIATRLLSYGFSEMDAFPGLNGEIRVTCYSSEKYLEFTVETVDSITFLFEDGDAEKEYQENITLAECFRKIDKYSQLCRTFALFTKDTLISVKGDSKALHSIPHQTEEFQFSVTIAPWKSADKSVNIFAFTTPTSVGNLRSSGFSTFPSCRTATA